MLGGILSNGLSLIKSRLRQYCSLFRGKDYAKCYGYLVWDMEVKT